MNLKPSELERFRLEGILGEGAELQVFAATDVETDQKVVVKRPHPTLISRSQHQAIDARLKRIVQLRSELGDYARHLPKLLAHTVPERHDDYFGETLGENYSVLVERLARGLPLVGSVIDRIKRIPIGLPQNLFALHPLTPHANKGTFTIQKDILDLVETFHKHGVLLLDLTPQNVFFDPLEAEITVIDIGSVTVEQEATRRRDAIDLHDCYLEVFKWYTTPEDPPQNVEGYGSPTGMESVAMFRQNLEAMINGFRAKPAEGWKMAALDILQKIRERQFSGIDDFRTEFENYLSMAKQRYAEMSRREQFANSWRRAKDSLFESYWRKFMFDPENDMQFYTRD